MTIVRVNENKTPVRVGNGGDAVTILGRALSRTAPTDGQTYTYVAATNTWVATSPAVGPPDYAGICVNGNSTPTVIRVVDGWKQITVFDADSPESVSNGIHGSDHIVVGATGVYGVHYNVCAASAGANKVYEFSVFSINPTGTVITGITQATPAVVTAAGHGLSNGNHVEIAGVAGMVEVNDSIFTVANKTDNTFELQNDTPANLNSAGYGAYTSGGVATFATKTLLHTIRKFAGGGDIGATSAAQNVALTLAGLVHLYVKNTTDAVDLTIDSANFDIFRRG